MLQFFLGHAQRRIVRDPPARPLPLSAGSGKESQSMEAHGRGSIARKSVYCDFKIACLAANQQELRFLRIVPGANPQVVSFCFVS